MTEIIRYTEGDKQEVIDLILNIQRNEFGIPISLADQPDLDDVLGYYQKDNGNFWVARMDDFIVGTIALLDIGNNMCALRKMFVNAKYRGRKYGIGQILLDTLLEWAVEKKFRQIILGTTDKFTRAQAFYEKNGFTEIRKEDLPATFPVMSVDVKFYCLRLKL